MIFGQGLEESAWKINEIMDAPLLKLNKEFENINVDFFSLRKQEKRSIVKQFV